MVQEQFVSPWYCHVFSVLVVLVILSEVQVILGLGRLTPDPNFKLLRHSILVDFDIWLLGDALKKLPREYAHVLDVMNCALFGELRVHFRPYEVAERLLNFKIVHICVHELSFPNNVHVMLDLEVSYLWGEITMIGLLDLIFYNLAIMFSHH